jgi:hypothetical protein
MGTKDPYEWRKEVTIKNRCVASTTNNDWQVTSQDRQ